ncbi:hypothetical protein [Vibrio phage VCPH]|nr:hypothetical protein [Vibrio phage VCPH]
MTKFKLTPKTLVPYLESTVVGTCTYAPNGSKAVSDAIFEAIAVAIEKHSGIRFNYDGVLLTVLSEKLACQLDVDLVWETFWDEVAGSGVDHCETCGWWSEEVHMNNENGAVCDECLEEED